MRIWASSGRHPKSRLMDLPDNPLDRVLAGWVVQLNISSNKISLLQTYNKRSRQSSWTEVRANARLLSSRSPLRLPHHRHNNLVLPLQILKIFLTRNSKLVLDLTHGDVPIEVPASILWQGSMLYVVLETR